MELFLTELENRWMAAAYRKTTQILFSFALNYLTFLNSSRCGDGSVV